MITRIFWHKPGVSHFSDHSASLVLHQAVFSAIPSLCRCPWTYRHEHSVPWRPYDRLQTMIRQRKYENMTQCHFWDKQANKYWSELNWCNALPSDRFTTACHCTTHFDHFASQSYNSVTLVSTHCNTSSRSDIISDQCVAQLVVKRRPHRWIRDANQVK